MKLFMPALFLGLFFSSLGFAEEKATWVCKCKVTMNTTLSLPGVKATSEEEAIDKSATACDDKGGVIKSCSEQAE